MLLEMYDFNKKELAKFLTKAQTQQLETVQKRAIQIILNFYRRMPYSSMLFAADYDHTG